MLINNFNSLFIPFRYAPLHKEGIKNISKLYLGLKIKCKFVTGLRSKKCKLNSGRDKKSHRKSHTHLQFAQAYTQTKNCKRVCLANALKYRQKE